MQSYKQVKMYDTVWSSHFDKFNTLRELNEYYNKRVADKEQDLLNASENEEIHKANAAEFNSIIEHAKSLGYKVSSYVTGTRKRSGYYKDEKWVDELRKQFPRSHYSAIYSSKQVENNYKQLEQYYEERKKYLERVEYNAKQSYEAEIENRQKDAIAIRLAVKYGLPEDVVDRDTIIETLVESDKYIMLATAMHETRNDWSDGFYRVKYALKKFVVSNEEDAAIASDVWECMDSDDGRVFRDTTYNYNVLYGMGNQELLADIAKIT